MREFKRLSDGVPEDKEWVIVKLNDGDVVMVQCLYCGKSESNYYGMIFWNAAWRDAYLPSRIVGYSRD